MSILKSSHFGNSSKRWMFDTLPKLRFTGRISHSLCCVLVKSNKSSNPIERKKINSSSTEVRTAPWTLAPSTRLYINSALWFNRRNKKYVKNNILHFSEERIKKQLLLFGWRRLESLHPGDARASVNWPQNALMDWFSLCYWWRHSIGFHMLPAWGWRGGGVVELGSGEWESGVLQGKNREHSY